MVVVNNTENEQTAANIVAGKVVSIENGEIKVKFDDKEDEGIIPLSKVEGDVAVDDIIKVRLEDKNGNVTITEIVEHIKPESSASDLPFDNEETSAAENEHPREDDDKPVIKHLEGKVIAINETTNRSDATLEIVTTKERIVVPLSILNFSFKVGSLLNLEFEEVGENHTLKSAKLAFSENESTEKNKGVLDDGDILATVVGITTINGKSEVTLKFHDTEEEVRVPQSALRIDVEPGYVIRLEMENKGKTRSIKAAQIYRESTTDKPEDSSKLDDKKEEDIIDLHYINKDLMMECMSIPSHSKLEFRMVSFIIRWARINKVQYEFDSYGNVYLTKGELAEGEYYPCVTSHMDTVQYKHDPYIYAGVPLALKIEKVKKDEHKLLVNNEDGTLGTEIGIGADDKAGILICLSLFEHFEKLKACFFLEEETGCDGSDHMDIKWFNNVGYVVGFDSPELYRAAWSCQNTKLFNYDFYEKWMKPVCDEWGLKNCFYSEPYTDVKNIREKTNIICMNFGNGGYNPHNIGGTEYLIMEDTDQACGMAIDLIDHIGMSRHILKHTRKPSITTNGCSYVRDENGVWNWECYDLEDDKKLEALGDDTRISVWSSNRSGTSNNNNTSGNNNNNSNNTNTTIVKTKEVSKKDEIKFETVKYIVNRYETHIESIKKELVEEVKKLCESKKVDSSEFEKVLSNAFNNEIKF